MSLFSDNLAANAIVPRSAAINTNGPKALNNELALLDINEGIDDKAFPAPAVTPEKKIRVQTF